METQSCQKLPPCSSEVQWMRVSEWPAYEVSSDGRVRRNGRILSLRVQRNGYWRVTLSDEPGGRRKTFMVHRLVAVAFHGTPPTTRHQVDHRNGDKNDNSCANLRWVTPRENRQDGRAASGSRNGASVLSEDQVRTLRALYDASAMSVDEIAAQFGVSRQTVTKIGRRKGWTHI
jgi:hypothetical protein